MELTLERKIELLNLMVKVADKVLPEGYRDSVRQTHIEEDKWHNSITIGMYDTDDWYNNNVPMYTVWCTSLGNGDKIPYGYIHVIHDSLNSSRTIYEGTVTELEEMMKGENTMMNTVEQAAKVDTNPLTTVVMPQKVWSKICDVLLAYRDGEQSEQQLQRELGALVYLFGEWDREVSAANLIRYGEYREWDRQALVDLAVGLRNCKDTMDALERAAKFLPEDAKEEYDTLVVQ